MVGIAFAVVFGMALAASGLIPAGTLFFFALFSLILSVVLRRTRWSVMLVLTGVAMVAACRFEVALPFVSEASMNLFRKGPPIANAGVVGQVSGFPRFHPYRSGTCGMWVFPVQCEGVQVFNVWKKRRGEIDVCVVGATATPPVQYGERIVLRGELRKRIYPGGNSVEIEVFPGGCSVLSAASHFSLVVWGRGLRESGARHLETGIEQLTVQQGVLKALVLGYRKQVPAETLDQFRRTGSLHIFAISGLHVGIVGLLLAIVLKAIGIPRDWFGVWLLPLLFLYVLSTGMKSSALRALAMAGVFVLAPMFRRRPDLPTSVAVAVVLLLVFQPLELMAVGFIFSFVVVAGIVMVFSALPENVLKGGWLRSYSISLVVTSFAASLASIPLAALFFGMFSPISLVGNLVVVPLTFFIVLSGWLSILLPVAASFFNHAAVVLINLLLGVVEKLDQVPGACWLVDPPPLVAVFLWYGSLVYLFAHASDRTRRLYAVAGAVCAVFWAVLV